MCVWKGSKIIIIDSKMRDEGTLVEQSENGKTTLTFNTTKFRKPNR